MTIFLIIIFALLMVFGMHFFVALLFGVTLSSFYRESLSSEFLATFFVLISFFAFIACAIILCAFNNSFLHMPY